MTDRVYIWFADNGNIRKWSREPFEAATAYLAALPAPDLAGKHERYMRAYFHEFTPTRVDAVDAVLEAIALAGKGYHYTGDWTDADQYGPDGYWSLIQLVANNAAVAFRSISAKLAAVERERDTLTERLAQMEAGRRQFPVLNSGGQKIDWQLVADHGKQAQANHYQTVERLAERGGLAWCELYAVLHNRPYQKMDENEAIIACRALEVRYVETRARKETPDA